MAKTILVVGGAGYIGSYVNKLLNLSGYETVILDNLSTGERRSVTAGSFVEGDLGERSDLDKLFTKYPIDAVMHFAAYIDVGESVVNPAKYYNNNVVKSITLLDTMLEYGVKTFLFSSSAAIFGIPEEEVISEEAPKNPINPYGETKLILEHILRDYSDAYGLRSCCLRYFNAAGGDPEGELINFRTNQTNLIPKALRTLLQEKSFLTIFGEDYDTFDGTCIRDYIHIHDLATAHILAMEKLKRDGEHTTYNLGNGRGFSVFQVVEAIERVTGRRLPIIHGERRAGDPPILVASSEKAKAELGWKPQHGELEAIVRDAWNCMQSGNAPLGKKNREGSEEGEVGSPPFGTPAPSAIN